jgi:hypothetical protein
MKKLLIGLAIAGGLTLIVIVCRFAYMILCISCTFPPIREYECACTLERLEIAFNNYSSQHPDIQYKASIRDSSKIEEVKYRDMVLIISKDSTTTSYGFVSDAMSDGEKTSMQLVSIESYTGKSKEYKGGYGINATGVKEFLNDLDKKILPLFIKEQQISIVSK